VVSRFRQWTLDVVDVEKMATFWSEVLGYGIEPGEGDDVHLRPSGHGAGQMSVWLQPTEHLKQGKNRDHPDLVVEDNDVDGEVERLLALGATHADVGQTGREGFVVLADPEGNEFCLLRTPPNRFSFGPAA
jgi:hypothetical protein